ncbi:MAG: hypothetical protein K1X92_12270 [Bacteroidia bacterium]|nr:hypothetical protein [Bacteroidia bacterium]
MKTFIPVILILWLWGGEQTTLTRQEKKTKPNTNRLFTINDYDEMWKKIQQLEEKGMTKDALKIAEEIFEKAKKESNGEQAVKSLLHVMKYKQVLEEKADSLNMVRISVEINRASAPVKQILQSVQANMFWEYYSGVRWQIYSRTRTEKFDNKDYQTWDASRFRDKIQELYLASLEQPETLAKIKTGEYKEIIEKGTERDAEKYRPSLYDLLAHRALDFFMNQELTVTNPAYSFVLEEEKAFAAAPDFASLRFDSKDSTSKDLHAARIFQQLLTVHRNNINCLVDVELKRLAWAKETASGQNKDSLYYHSLISLTQKYPQEPVIADVWAEIAAVHSSRAAKYNPDTEKQYRMDYVKSLEICDEMIKKFPEARGTQRCKDIKNNILSKSVGITVEDISVPDEKSRLYITYRNEFQWYFRIIPYNESVQIRMNSEHDLVKRMEILTNQKPLKSWQESLPVEKDYQTHSADLAVPETPAGKYWILVSDNAGFSVQNHVVNYGYWDVCTFAFYTIKNPKQNKVEYFVTERKTGKPLKGVEVKWTGTYYDYQSYGEKKVQKNAMTDINGVAEVALPDVKNSYLNYSAEIIRGKEKYNTQTDYHYSQGEETESRKVVFFTDRKIYRPGQTVYFKGICLKSKGGKSDIITGYNTNVLFRDVNYQQIATLKVASNEYGTFSGTFTAPVSGLMGNMSIVDEKSGHSTDFSVEEYKRPKFEVIFNPMEGSFRLGEKVTAKGNAMGYAGNAIDGAQVKYRVVRKAIFPYWGYYCWWRPAPASPEVEIGNGETKTDENGNFSVDFMAIPDPLLSKEDKPQFTYSVYADVVDITGETHSASQNLSVGYIAISAGLNIPGHVSAENPDSLTVNTENLNGAFEPAKGKIEIYPIEMPKQWFRARRWGKADVFPVQEQDYRKWFPYDAYSNESDYRNWKKKEKIATISFDTEKSKKYALSSLKNQPQGTYIAELSTADKYGNSIKVTSYFDLESRTKSTPVKPVALSVEVRKNVVEPGENLEFTVSSSEKNLFTVLTIEQNGTILDRRFITLNNEKRELTFPVKEEHRGNFNINTTAVIQNEFHSSSQLITVPFTNKNLKMEWMTFRNKLLPGAKEEWRLKISGPGQEKAAAEMIAGMYDASLDQFRANSWDLSGLNPYYYGSVVVNGYVGFQTKTGNSYDTGWNSYTSYYTPTIYNQLNLFGFYFSPYRRMREDMVVFEKSAGVMPTTAAMESPPPPPAPAMAGESDRTNMAANGEMEEQGNKLEKKPEAKEGKDGKEQKKEIQIRKNLQETAFFFPHLMTSEKGEIILSFTMPEALTKWKFMALAHTKDLKTGMLTENVVTQKDLMVMPNPPRFMRVGDDFEFSAKISNLSDKKLNGSAEIIIRDALTGNEITGQLIPGGRTTSFTAESKQSALVSWNIKVPDNIQAVVYQVIASAGDFSDGEENALPVVLNKMLVTESLALWVKGGQSRTFILPNLVNSGESKTLKNQQYTLEFTANPAWYAVQSLPYLMEYPHECTEQLFSRYYANSLATHIGNSTPRIRQVFEQWKNAQGGNKEALLSNLSKNQELKSAILEETPWVLNANDETERKKRVALLFDLNKMADEMKKAESKLRERQNGNGSFTWFPGMKDDRYITQLIVTGMGHLRKLKVTPSAEVQGMIEKALPYLDRQMKEDYLEMKRRKVDMEKNQLGYGTIQYLYMRSFYPEIKIPGDCREAYDYYFGQAKKYAFENGIYMKGMLSLILNRGGETKQAQTLIQSIAQNAVHNEEMGMYWKETAGWSWWQASIEMQALLIEAFDEVTGDQASVEEMKIWLLKNKQTNDWKTTRATVEACNALLLTGSNWLENTEVPEITIGNKPFLLAEHPEIQTEAGTGYFKKAWQASEISPEFGTVTVTKKEKGIAWGGVFWQYFEQLDKIKYAETPLSIRKQVFIERPSATGPIPEPVSSGALIKQGDKVKIRIEIRTDRDMEYVHLKDMRAAGFEPVDVISSYRYQDGLGYYQSTRDIGTHFFMDYLPKGTYMFEYALRATHKGDFSNGITTMQCMYAPEFTSHSEGIRVKIQ